MIIPDASGLGVDNDQEEIVTCPYQPHHLRYFTGALTDIRPAGEAVYYSVGGTKENKSGVWDQ